jgi:3D (Asp-Asp-Asp) domain-containing protein
LLVIVAMVTTPTVLFWLERAENEALRSENRQVSLELHSESAFWRTSTVELLEERDRLTQLALDAGHAVEEHNKVTVKVVATGYSSSIWETDMTPFITAANTPTRTGIMAMSRDLLTRYTPDAPFSFGDRVHVPGLGDFLVEDSMNARWDNRIDVWFPSRLEALRFGVREVYVSKTLEEEEAGPLGQDVSENDGASTEGGGL